MPVSSNANGSSLDGNDIWNLLGICLRSISRLQFNDVEIGAVREVIPTSVRSIPRTLLLKDEISPSIVDLHGHINVVQTAWVQPRLIKRKYFEFFVFRVAIWGGDIRSN